MSLEFNGVSHKVTITDAAVFDFAGSNWTVCWWEYRTSNTAAKCPIARDEITVAVPWLLGFVTGANILAYMSSDGIAWDIVSGGVIGTYDLNAWNHFVVTRNGSTFTPYKNGVAGSTWSSALVFPANANPLSIGVAQNTNFFQGQLADVRIYNGTAYSVNHIKTIYESRGNDNITVNLVLRMLFNEEADGNTVAAVGDLRDVSPLGQTIAAVGTAFTAVGEARTGTGSQRTD